MMPLGDTVRDFDLTTLGDRAYSQTEDSAERGFARLHQGSQDPVTYKNLGRAEGLDDDAAGDIADEGRGHRG